MCVTNSNLMIYIGWQSLILVHFASKQASRQAVYMKHYAAW